MLPIVKGSTYLCEGTFEGYCIQMKPNLITLFYVEYHGVKRGKRFNCVATIGRLKIRGLMSYELVL